MKPISRRHFMTGSAATLTALATWRGLSNDALASPASARKTGAPTTTRTLVLVELKGGNDGLNMLFPLGHPAYRRARPSIAVDDADGLAFADGMALHPAMGPLLPTMEAGELCMVSAVGYPHPNRSHFRSIQIWDQASAANEILDDGWLTRVVRAARPAWPASGGRLEPLDGVIVRGDDGPLEGGHALHLDGADLGGGRRGRDASWKPIDTSTMSAAARHIVAVRDDVVAQTASLSLRLADIRLPTATPALPPRLEGVIDITARLATLGAGGDHTVPAVKLTMPGFDTHTRQRATQDRLLGELASGLASLRQRLVATGAWDDTVVVVMSEFGRRIAENNNGGTDHGAAGPMMILGGAVRGGLIGGTINLEDPAQIEKGDLAPRITHRDVFASVARGTFGLSDGALQHALSSSARLPVWSRT